MTPPVPSPQPPDGTAEPGSFFALADALERIAGEIHPSLNSYRWWTPAAHLPAAYWWAKDGSVGGDGVCLVTDELALTFSIAVQPHQHAGDDLLSLEQYIDLARPVLSHAFSRDHAHAELGGARRAKRTGFRLARDTFGNTSVLVAEFPVSVTLATQI